MTGRRKYSGFIKNVRKILLFLRQYFEALFLSEKVMVVRSHYRIISVLLALLVIGMLSILGYFLICMLLLDPEALQGELVYVTVGLWIWLVLVFLVLRIVLKDIRHIRIDQEKLFLSILYCHSSGRVTGGRAWIIFWWFRKCRSVVGVGMRSG